MPTPTDPAHQVANVAEIAEQAATESSAAAKATYQTRPSLLYWIYGPAHSGKSTLAEGIGNDALLITNHLTTPRSFGELLDRSPRLIVDHYQEGAVPAKDEALRHVLDNPFLDLLIIVAEAPPTDPQFRSAFMVVHCPRQLPRDWTASTPDP